MDSETKHYSLVETLHEGSSNINSMPDVRLLQVISVDLPGGSSVGYGEGQDVQTGEWIRFLGDHRPMHQLCEELAFLAQDDVSSCLLSIDGWQVCSVEPASTRHFQDGLWAAPHSLGGLVSLVSPKVNGTTYQAGTPVAVVLLLEQYRMSETRRRLRLHYGDSATGLAWGDSDTGYIGRSTGRERVPLTIARVGVRGGPAISTAAIVKIEAAQGSKTLWQHPQYHQKQQAGDEAKNQGR